MTDPLPHPVVGRHGLLRRLMLLILAAILAPMVLLGVFGWASLGDVRDGVLAQRLATARAAAAYFDHGIRESLEALASIPWTADPSARLEAMRAARQRSRLIRCVSIIDASGTVVAHEGPPEPDHNAVQSGAVVPDRGSGEPELRPEVDGPFAGRGIRVVVPLRDAPGRVAGAAVGLWDTSAAAWTTMARAIDPGTGIRLDLVDAEGGVVLSAAGASGFRASPEAAALFGPGEPRRAIARIVTLADGTRTIAAFAPIAVTKWGVVVSEPERRGLAALHGLQRRWLVLGVICTLVGAFYAWGVAASVKRPLALLDEAATRLADGELDRPVPVRGEDELGRLGRSFEIMRRRLRGTVEELTLANEEMERRVEQRTHELRALYRELSVRDEQRSRLLAKAISAQEEERKRIARELHDETCQTLTALAMRLDLAQAAKTPDEASVRFDEAKALAARSVDELHRVIYDLRPSVLDDLGLVAAVRWLADRHLTALGLRVRIEAGDIERRLPIEMEIAMFRAVQEAISNIVRHAGAENVLIQMDIRQGMVEVEVEDDGRGFDPAEAARPEASGRGLGILGIRERLEMLGGSATVESSAGAGTRVVLRAPVPPEVTDAG